MLAAIVPIVVVAAIGTRPAMLTAQPALRARGHGRRHRLLASLALSIAGARARDGRAMLMGTAFSTMTALFAVHALATPRILTPASTG